MMQLIIGGSRTIDEPTDIDIAQAIGNLPEMDDDFVILAASDQFFVQCAGNDQVGYDLEYRDGGQASHYRATNPEIGSRQIIVAMQKYCRGNLNWNKGIAFEKLESLGEDLSVEPPRAKGEKLFEVSNGVLIIGWRWVATISSLLLMAAGVAIILFIGNTWFAVRIGGFMFAIGFVMFLLPKSSQGDKRGYRF